MNKIIVLAFFLSSLLIGSESKPTEEEVTKLYVATFNRAPDSAGLSYWIYDSKLTLSQIAQSFFDQKETQELYPPSVSISEFIEAVYLNLFNREPDEAGWDYWIDELINHKSTKNVFILTVINGALDTDISKDKTILNNKTEVGEKFANSGLNDTSLAKKVIQDINASKESVKKADEEIQKAVKMYQIPEDPQQQRLSYPGKYPGMFLNTTGFVALKNDGTIINWPVNFGIKKYELDDIKAVYSTQYAFALLRNNGTVITWGDPTNGGDSSKVQDKLTDVKYIYSIGGAFAALKNDGTVVCWGNFGEYIIKDNQKIIDSLTNVKTIYTNLGAFAALKNDGTVVTWGVSMDGGDSSMVADQLTNIKVIYSANESFLALKKDGTIVRWGVIMINDKIPKKVTNVKKIYSNLSAYAILKNDGSVITWGTNGAGGIISADFNSTKVNNVKAIYPVYYGAFAALKNDASVVVWGYGNDNSCKILENMHNIKEVYTNSNAIAVLRTDGTVVTCGRDWSGGDSSAVSDKLTNIKKVYSSAYSFAALKNDGTVITWGETSSGGDVSVVKDEVSNVKTLYSYAFGFAALENNGIVESWNSYDFKNNDDIRKELVNIKAILSKNY